MKTIARYNRRKPESRPAAGSYPQRWLRRRVLSCLEGIRHGCLTVHDPHGSSRFGETAKRTDLDVHLYIHDMAAYTDIALGGDIGAGEAYMDGRWHSNDLTRLVRLMVRNRDVLTGLGGGPARLTAPLQKLAHRLRDNHRRGSRRNIGAHYDLGNDFFALFLDRQRMYSAAVFPDENADLEQATAYKLGLICRKLDLKPGDHLLEIGTGWGGLAIHAARHYGCRVTTTTLSREQYQLAAGRIRTEGLEDRITLRLDDYRDLDGRYDKLVSVEMIEAVGHRYFPAFFRACSRLLKDDGLMLLQSITIADRFYRQALKSVDFIQRHIFPGGCLPSVGAITDSTARHTDLALIHMADFADHYARTLRAWRQRFFERLDRVRALGYSDRFIRMWEYYLCYCEGGFLERSIGVSQMLFAKPANRRPAMIGDIP